MTGHLVLSTLHANDSVAALSRLAELGIEYSVTANVVLGVIAQRLVRLNCTACAAIDHPRMPYLDCLGIPRSDVGRLRQSPGCEACNFTGTRGRAGMFELLDIGGKIRDLCAAGDEIRIRRGALEAGMISLRHQAATLALAGTISVDEAYRFGYFGDVS